ncbi:MAG: hypothetical protein AB7G17_01005 [Phycisphaerales bacterium]
MKPAIVQAIDEIRCTFVNHPIDVIEDGEGGAFVKVHGISIGPKYNPSMSSIAFRITFQYPMADVYPHFLIHGLRRADGAALTNPFHPDNQRWGPSGNEEPATMLSRRSNHLDAAVDTACGKLLKVLEWIRSQ